MLMGPDKNKKPHHGHMVGFSFYKSEGNTKASSMLITKNENV